VAPSKGTGQVTVTESPLKIVVGAAGLSGFYAASTDKAIDKGEYPTVFLASTLN
jgi:hypothetical protein